MPLTIENGCEYGALIYEVEVDGVIGYTLVLIGDTRDVFIDRAFGAVPEDAKVVGIMHTHPPDGSPYFSPGDRDKAKQHGMPIYLGNKAGVVMK